MGFRFSDSRSTYMVTVPRSLPPTAHMAHMARAEPGASRGGQPLDVHPFAVLSQKRIAVSAEGV
jgi:hypothetical protein